MSRAGIAARFVTSPLLRLDGGQRESERGGRKGPHSYSSPSSSSSSLVRGDRLLRPFSPTPLAAVARKTGGGGRGGGGETGDKMQSLYSRVSVYEPPFAFASNWVEWLLGGLSLGEVHLVM